MNIRYFLLAATLVNFKIFSSEYAIQQRVKAILTASNIDLSKYGHLQQQMENAFKLHGADSYPLKKFLNDYMNFSHKEPEITIHAILNSMAKIYSIQKDSITLPYFHASDALQVSSLHKMHSPSPINKDKKKSTSGEKLKEKNSAEIRGIIEQEETIRCPHYIEGFKKLCSCKFEEENFVKKNSRQDNRQGKKVQN